jgi:hypothetical protein
MIGKIFRRRFPLPFAAIACLATAALRAHPIPDVPVHSAFDSSGAVTITIELDARCFETDPETAPYLLAADFQSGYPEDDRQELIRKARSFIPAVVEFEFKPGGKIRPDFEVEFVTKDGEELGATGEVIFLSATATVPVPKGARDYRIHALDYGYLTVLFHNALASKPVERFQALFPGETSYWLDLRLGDLLADSIGQDPAPSPSAPSNLPILIAGSLLALAVVGWMTYRASTRP